MILTISSSDFVALVAVGITIIIALMTGIASLLVWILNGIRSELAELREDRNELWATLNRHLLSSTHLRDPQVQRMREDHATP